MPILVYTPSEFSELHGGRDTLRKLDNRTYAFADGASIVRDQQGYEVCVEPPSDRKELLLAQRRYHSLYVAAGEQDFKSLTAAIKGEGFITFSAETIKRYGVKAGMNDEEAIEVLKTIRRIVVMEQATIARIDLELSRFPEVMEERRRKDARAKIEQQMEADESRRFTRMRAIVDDITLDHKPETENEHASYLNSEFPTLR